MVRMPVMHSPAPIAAVLAAAVLSLCLAVAPAAADTTIAFDGTTVTISGDDGDSYIFDTAFDDPFDSQFDPANPVFVAQTGSLAAGPGCEQRAAQLVACPGAGSATAATVSLGGGNDFFAWSSTTVPLTIDGGDGNDELLGGRGDDTIGGGAGNDTIVGYGGDDTLDGGAGNDTMTGSNGDDRLVGGSGTDTLNGDGEEDPSVTKKPGNDRIDAKDGARDTVQCEGGRDTLSVDKSDVVAGCSGAANGGDSAGSASAGGLRVTVRRTTFPTAGAFARGMRLRFTVRTTLPCNAAAALTVTRAEARRLRYRRSLTITRTSRIVRPGTPVTMSIRGSAGFRKALRAKAARRRAATLALRVRCSPGVGRAATVRLAVKLRR